MSYSKDISDAIHQFLTDDDWRFSFDEDLGMFRFDLSMKGKLKNIPYRILVHQKSFVLYAMCPMSADDCCTAMSEFTSRVNYGLRNGNFELDFRDGEIRYKSFVDCDNQIPSSDVIRNSIYAAAGMFNRYGDGIIAILFNLQTPEEAVAACEKDLE